MAAVGTREWEQEKTKLTKMAAMGNMAARKRLEQLLSEEWNNPPALDPDYVEPPKEETKNNDGLLDKLKDIVVNAVKKDPIKAAEKPVDVAVETIYRIETGKTNISPVLEDSTVDFILPDEPTVITPLGDTGPIIKKEATNIIQDGGEAVVKFVEDTQDNFKKYLPVALIGGAALLLISALK